MDIHPLIVHFPIALLTLYAVMEFVRVKRIREHAHWFTVKAALVVLGTFGAFAAFATGDEAEHAARTNQLVRTIVHTHQLFAGLATALFAALALAYCIGFVRRTFPAAVPTAGTAGRAASFLRSYERLVLESPVRWVLVVAGLLSIIVTGALGGAMVYGPGVDPVAQFVYSLFF